MPILFLSDKSGKAGRSMVDFRDEKWKKRIEFSLCIIGVIFFFKYILPFCWPLIIAFIIVSFLYDRLWIVEKKMHINRNVLAVTLVVFGLSTVVTLLLGVIYASSKVVVNHVGNVEKIQSVCICCVDKVCKGISDVSGMKIDDVTRTVNEGIGQVGLKMQEIVLPQFLEKSMLSFKFIVSVMAVLLITGILIVLLVNEYGKWREIIYGNEILLPIYSILSRLRGMLFQYIKAELIIMLVITTIVFTGMYFASVKEPFLLALLTGFLDMLPFIGTGLVLFPLGIWFVMEERYMTALILLLVYIVCVVVRQYLEPKLVSHGMHVSAAGVLMAIFAGIKLYGITGVLLGPVTLMILVECFREIYNKEEKS